MGIIDYITGSISLAAIVISIIAFVQNLKIEKRQLRIGKMEEMLEITHILNINYQYFDDTHFFKTQLLSDQKESNDTDKYLSQVKSLSEISDEIDIRNKLAGLYVLNNSSKKKILMTPRAYRNILGGFLHKRKKGTSNSCTSS